MSEAYLSLIGDMRISFTFPDALFQDLGIIGASISEGQRPTWRRQPQRKPSSSREQKSRNAMASFLSSASLNSISYPRSEAGVQLLSRLCHVGETGEGALQFREDCIAQSTDNREITSFIFNLDSNKRQPLQGFTHQGLVRKYHSQRAEAQTGNGYGSPGMNLKIRRNYDFY
jgi:hypothetical protein